MVCRHPCPFAATLDRQVPENPETPLISQRFRLTPQRDGGAPLRKFHAGTLPAAVASQGGCGSPRSAPVLLRPLPRRRLRTGTFPITTRGCLKGFRPSRQLAQRPVAVAQLVRLVACPAPQI